MKLLDTFHLKLTLVYPSTEIDALYKIVLSNVLSIPYHQVQHHNEPNATESQIDQIHCILQQLQNHKPIQYILNQAHFMGLDLYVNEHVLIPRTETEELVDYIVKQNSQLASPTIIDMGTGSGCIAIALKKLLPKSQVTAIDISDKALKVAQKNAEKFNLSIQFISNNILQLSISQSFDIIVSNPPYIHEHEASQMEAHVLQHEPHLALFVKNKNPIIFYEKIIAFAKEKLNPRGKLYFEINPLFQSEMKECCLNYDFHNIIVLSDMQGKARILVAEKK